MLFALGKAFQLIGMAQLALGLYYGIFKHDEKLELIVLVIGVAFFSAGWLMLRRGRK